MKVAEIETDILISQAVVRAKHMALMVVQEARVLPNVKENTLASINLQEKIVVVVPTVDTLKTDVDRYRYYKY